jgi:hypothetical protein
MLFSVKKTFAPTHKCKALRMFRKSADFLLVPFSLLCFASHRTTTFKAETALPETGAAFETEAALPANGARAAKR